ncbi:MAG: hypothetical protein PVJ39_21765 [Gammaproteobacteria bacterium]|jgi:hypothetical protein
MPKKLVFVRHFIFSGLILALTACGGGGDGGGGSVGSGGDTGSGENNSNNPSNPPSSGRVTLGDFNGIFISGNTKAGIQRPAVYNSNGNALLVWYEDSGTTTNNFFKFWDAGNSTWTEPASLPFNVATSFITSSGNNFLAFDYTNNDFKYSVFDGNTWSTPAAVPLNLNGSPISFSYISNFKLLSISSGYVFLFTGQTPGQIDSNIYAITFNGTKWSDLQIYATSNTLILKEADAFGNNVVFHWVDNVTGDPLPYKNYLSLKTANGIYTQTVSESTGNIVLDNFSIKHSNSGFAASWLNNDGNFDRVYTTQIDAAATTPTWSAVTPMDQGTENSQMPVLASNGSGFALLWATQDTYEVAARVYSGSWGPEQPLNDTSNSLNIRDIKLTSNGTGFAATWYNRPVTPDGRYRYYGAIYDGNSWLATSTLGVGGQNDNLQYKPLRITSNGSDYAVAWIDSEIINNVQDPYLSVFGSVSAGNAWPANPQKISPTLIGYSTFVVGGLFLALNQYSDGFGVIWPQIDTTHYDYYRSMFDSTNGWKTAASVINPQSKGSSVTPVVARNNNGDLAVAWAQYDVGSWKYYLNTKTANGWGTAREIVECSDYSVGSQIEIVSNGSSYMIGCLGYDYSGFSGQSRFFLVPFDGENFGTPEAVTDYSYPVSLASNGSSYAFALGTIGATDSISVKTYDGRSWSTATTVADNLTQLSKLTLSGFGSTYALSWHVDTGISQSVYNATSNTWDTLPVTNTGSSEFNMRVTGPDNITYAWADGSIHSMNYNNGSFTGPLDAELLSETFTRRPSLSQSSTKLGIVWSSNANIYANFYDGTWGTTPDSIAALGTDNFFSTYPSLVSTNGDFAVGWGEQQYPIPADFYVRILRTTDTTWEPKLTTHQDRMDFSYQRLFTDGPNFRITGSLIENTQDATKNYGRIWFSDAF